jgi:hypothetical protein
MPPQLFEFNEENASGWYTHLKPDEKKKLNSAVEMANKYILSARRNGLPTQYIGVAKKLAKRMNADPSGLTDEQIFALDNTIIKTAYDQNIYGKIIGSVRSAQAGNVRWTNKNYKLDEDLLYPGLTRDFKNPVLIKLGVEPAQTTGIGMAIGYEISWTQLAEARGGLYSPDFYHSMVASERMGILQDEMGWNGTLAGHNFNGDMGVKGLFNHASVQSGTWSDPTTLWNNKKALENFAGKLKGVYQAGKRILVTTSGLASQLFYNMTTTGNIDTELSLIKKYFNNYFDEWWVSDRLYSAGAGTPTAVANTTQCAMGIIVGPTLQKHEDIYPMQTKPMANKEYAEDIKEIILYGYNLIQYGVQLHPTVVASAITTTDTGFIKNGRFL